MTSPLEYARPDPPARSLALPAFVCGACSGPAAYALAALSAHNHLEERTKESLMLASLALVLGGAFVFALWVRRGLPAGAAF